MRGLLGAIIVTVSLIASTSGQSAATAAPAPASFVGAYFHPTNGRVGYHMTSRYDFQATPCRPDEHPHLADITLKGTLPPGVTAPGSAGNGTPNFEGTPRQAGDWEVYVTMMDLTCTATFGVAGPVDYGNLTIAVGFHIDP